jgi:hypothetical protein
VDSRHPAQTRSGATLHLVPSTGQDGATVDEARGSRSFRRYPLWRVLCLNGLTLGQYVVGCAAILVAYRGYPILGWPIGLAYLVFAVVQLYVLMPLVVCPGCVYRTVRDGRCASGLNLVSARLCPPSAGASGFEERAHGALCQSSLCLWSWVLPVPLALPALAVSFSWLGLTLTAAVAVLAVIRLAVVERLVVCSHCLARRWCPVARARRPA